MKSFQMHQIGWYQNSQFTLPDPAWTPIAMHPSAETEHKVSIETGVQFELSTGGSDFPFLGMSSIVSRAADT